jgi:endonuclease III
MCTLNYTSPLDLLVATQLAAQCTDERVNLVTPALFKRFRTPEDYYKAERQELIGYIRSTGFFNNKSENIQKCCKMLAEKHSGMIPDNMEDLLELPGIGRKTANVILGEIYGKPGVIIDTHAKRLSNRIGLSDNTDPGKIETDLMKIIPEDKWTMFSHRLVYHGRQVCKARKPLCSRCVINNFCKYYSQIRGT